MKRTAPILLLALASCMVGKPPDDDVADDDGSGGDDTAPPCDDPATCDYEAGCPPILDPSSLESCAPDAHCFSKDPIPVEERDRFAECPGGDTLCIPDIFLETGGQFTLATCHSLYDGEGRCVSLALVDIAAQADTLPQDTCASYERCAPCYNPLDGTETGLCALACDAGPTEPPVVAPSCCQDVGTCIPAAQVPPDRQAELLQDTCEAQQLCIPDALITNTLVTCDAELLGGPIGEGRCLPDCMAQTGGINGAVMTGDCSAAGSNFKCFPCNDPLSGEPTGLCTM
jgi:hypothetical protein